MPTLTLVSGPLFTPVEFSVQLFFDTYEIVDKIDPWVRLIMAYSGSRTVWVLSGRDNLVESRRYGKSYFIGYQGEAPAERLRTFPMSEFNQNDIITYFAKKVSTRPLTLEQATKVQHATYGIPLAVETAAALWARGASLDAIIEGIPERADRETIVRAMTDRLLVHARADLDHPQDVFYLFALSLAYQPDYDILAALWEGKDVRQLLDDMERRYEFVFAYKMRLRDEVRDFLREYLLADVERRSSPIQSINKRAISLLEQRLTSSHRHLQTLEARIEDDHWVTTILALTWHRLWLDEELGWKTLQIVFLAAQAYDRELALIMLSMADFFASTWSKSRKRLLKSLYTISKAAAIIEDEAVFLNIFEQALSGEEIQPDQGCATEFAAIIWWLRGRMARQQGQTGEALKILSEAGRQVPEKAQSLRVKLGLEFRLLADELWRGQKRYEEAIAALNQAIELNPKYSRAWHSLGHVYQEQGRVEEAIRAFEQASMLTPKQPENWLCLGDIYKGQGQLDKAISTYQLALEGDVNKKLRAILLHRLGLVYLEQAKMEQAEKSFKEATVLDPQAIVPWDSLGHLYEEQGQLEEAVKAYQKAIKKSSNNRQKCLYLCRLGDVYCKQKRFKEATLVYDQAKIIDPNSGIPWHGLGHVYDEQGQVDEAIKAFQLAHSLDPRKSDHLHCLGRVYIKNKQLEEAIDVLLKSIEREEKAKDQALTWHRISHLYDQQGRIDEALKASQQSTALDPTKFFYWFSLGDLWRKQDQPEEAVNAYGKGIELIPQELSDSDSVVEVRQYLEENSD